MAKDFSPKKEERVYRMNKALESFLESEDFLLSKVDL